MTAVTNFSQPVGLLSGFPAFSVLFIGHILNWLGPPPAECWLIKYCITLKQLVKKSRITYHLFDIWRSISIAIYIHMLTSFLCLYLCFVQWWVRTWWQITWPWWRERWRSSAVGWRTMTTPLSSCSTPTDRQSTSETWGVSVVQPWMTSLPFFIN